MSITDTVHDSEEPSTSFFLVFTVVMYNLTSFVVGASVGSTSFLIERLKSSDAAANPLKAPITTSEASFVATALPVGVIIGALIVASLVDHIGRKYALIAMSFFALLGYIIFAFSKELWLMCTGRVIIGTLWGATYVTLPHYAAEVANAHDRGMLISISRVAMNLGKLTTLMLGQYLTIKYETLLCAVVLILFIIVTYKFLPASPYYLVYRQKTKVAAKALSRLRNKSRSRIHGELLEIDEFVTASYLKRHKNPCLKVVTTEILCERLLLLGALFLFQQFSGINAIMFYIAQIFKSAEESLPVDISSVIIATTQFITTILPLFLLDTYGRRPLLIISSIVCSVSLGIFAMSYALPTNLRSVWIPIVSLIVYISGFNLGLGPVPFVLLGELFPPHVKVILTPAVIVVDSIYICVITTLFPHLLLELGPGTTFWIFSTISGVGAIFMCCCVPETKMKTLMEINRVT